MAVLILKNDAININNRFNKSGNFDYGHIAVELNWLKRIQGNFSSVILGDILKIILNL